MGKEITSISEKTLLRCGSPMERCEKTTRKMDADGVGIEPVPAE